MKYIYSFLCFVLPSVIWQIANENKLKKKEHAIRHIVWTYIFLLYCYLVVEVAADMGTVWDILKYRGIKGQVYLKPFVVYEYMSHILNVVMFMPLGFLMPLIWSNFRRVLKTTMLGLLMSIAIEVSQLFCYRVTDVNDLITNTVGTTVGYILWIIFHKIFINSGKKSVTISRTEPIVYIFGGMISIFCLYVK